MEWLLHNWATRRGTILADEMGLGKTLMTISMLAWLACERGIWGPHLIVVPTSVMVPWQTLNPHPDPNHPDPSPNPTPDPDPRAQTLTRAPTSTPHPTPHQVNWEMEIKKFAPAFKILTYFGTQKERRLKRTGWSKTNAFHICITSYKLVIQDQAAFRRSPNPKP